MSYIAEKKEGDLFSLKSGPGKESAIPAPVSTSPPRVSSGRRWKLIALATTAAVLFNVFFRSLAAFISLQSSDAQLDEIDYSLFDYGVYYAYTSNHTEKPSHKKHPKFAFLNGKLAEKLYLTVPNGESASKASRLFTKEPHVAGTPGDYKTALDYLSILQEEFDISVGPELPVFDAGSEESRQATLEIPYANEPRAWIDTYYPVLNHGKEVKVEILGDGGETEWTADLSEKAPEKDQDAYKFADAVLTFHGYSAAGTAEGKLVYANYGTQKDYEELDAAGIELRDKIVIVRYGGNFRGSKVQGAEERGAVGVLIYSDYRDDGSVTSENGYDSYPYGPARNPTSVQRGSVQFLTLYPGDATTPGYPSYKNATRQEGVNRPKIPSVPISAENAEILLKEIKEDGKNRVVKIVNDVEDKVSPIWNVMGVIPGHIKDEVVMVGNHRDAWVMGAADPSSGTVSAVEMIRGFANLYKKGWRPLRTLVIASWDAEEYGLIGSTEYCEDFPEFFTEHVAAYVNLDVSTRGSRFKANASPSLAHLVKDIALSIPHPTLPGKSVWDARDDSGPYEGAIAPGVQEMHELMHGYKHEESTGVSPLGSGSDYTAPLQRLGVASTDFGFDSGLQDPVYHYHSVFDSHTWQAEYADPGFHKHVAMAKLLGVETLRLLDSIVLPINTTQYAFELQSYLKGVEDIADAQNFETDFSSLRESFASLQTASIALDEEKALAEHELKKELRKMLLKRGKGWLRRKWRAIKRRIRKWLHRHRKHHKHPKHPKHPKEPKEPEDPEDPKEPGDEGVLEIIEHHEHHHCGKDAEHDRQETHSDHEQQELNLDSKPHFPHLPKPKWPKIPHFPWPHWPGHGHKGKDKHHHRHHKGKKPSPPKPSKELIEAVKRVRAVNKKLVAFERGFISEEGLKGRTWYKHLVVAPGKNLGYGATPLPGVTEALTIDKNTTLAEYEADRLQKLIVELVKEITV